MLLLSHCGSIALWIYCKWNQQRVLLILCFTHFSVREHRERKAISVEEKLDIPAPMHINRLTHVALAATFRIVHWQWTLLLKVSRLESVMNYGADSLVKRGVSVTSSRIAGFVSHVARSTVICGILLRERALHFTTKLDIEDLKASNRWIGGFKQQHSVVYKTVLGECNSVDFWTVEEWRKEELLTINEGFECKDIYNADETGMFFRLPPNTTLSLKVESFNGRRN